MEFLLNNIFSTDGDTLDSKSYIHCWKNIELSQNFGHFAIWVFYVQNWIAQRVFLMHII